jgi:iron(III) transport system substrate-binding protein
MKRWLAMLALAAPGYAMSQGNLVLYCTVQEEWCRAMVTAF